MEKWVQYLETMILVLLLAESRRYKIYGQRDSLQRADADDEAWAVSWIEVERNQRLYFERKMLLKVQALGCGISR